MTAWMIRGGSLGERESWAIETGFSGGGFEEVGDLTGCNSRDEIFGVLQSAFPGGKKQRNMNFAAQLWALRGRIEVGDLVVMPLHPSTHIAIGRCSTPYTFLSNEVPGRQHVIGVNWTRIDVPRGDIKQDLLFSLGAFMTVCRVDRNDAENRLKKLMAGSKDPGAELPSLPTKKSPAISFDENDPAPEDVDIEEVARDRIRTRLIETFQSHQLADLTAAILRVRGLECIVSPPGPDKGIDILAGAGPLGLDSPRIVVQCKSSDTPADVSVIQRLQGAMSTLGAEQALLVAFAGVNKSAMDLLTNQQFKVKVWDADAVLDATLQSYDQLDSSIQELLPLKNMWTLSNPNE
jgi:restriction system protein